MAVAEVKPALTSRQKQIYEFLKDKIRNRGYGPTVREIGTHFGIRSPNGVMCHLKALERKGLITRESHMSRAIQLSESPQLRTSLPLAGQIAESPPAARVSSTPRTVVTNTPNSTIPSLIHGGAANGRVIAKKRFIAERRCRSRLSWRWWAADGNSRFSAAKSPGRETPLQRLAPAACRASASASAAR